MAGLAVGATFSSTDDAIAYVSTYNDTNFTNFVKTSNCKKPWFISAAMEFRDRPNLRGHDQINITILLIAKQPYGCTNRKTAP